LRAFRWVELVSLDAAGRPAGNVRRVSSETGRASSFELVSSGTADVIVVVQDEASHGDGAGARVVRHIVEGERVTSSELLGGGVGHALVDLFTPPPASGGGDAGGGRWMSFTDTQERARLLPLGANMVATGEPSSEPALEGARVVATATDGSVFAVGPSGSPDAAPRGWSLRRYVCR
jgi:hypothetical protein